MSSVGRMFLDGSRYHRDKKVTDRAPDKSEASAIRRIPLKKGFTAAGPPIFNAMSARRSHRDFDQSAPVTFYECSDILFAAQGNTSSFGGVGLRAAPSAGARYPIDLYLSARNVSGLEPGCYKLDVDDWCLVSTISHDPSRELYAACLNQDFVLEAALNVIMTAVPHRSTSRYRDRGIRYVFMDAAHIGQNILLAATALGLGACAVGAFFDDEVEAVVGADGEKEIAVYMISIGRPK